MSWSTFALPWHLLASTDVLLRLTLPVAMLAWAVMFLVEMCLFAFIVSRMGVTQASLVFAQRPVSSSLAALGSVPIHVVNLI